MKAQTKSNAERSAKAATERTTFEHEIYEVEGGWSFRLAASKDEPPPQTLAEFTAEVEACLAAEEAGFLIKDPSNEITGMLRDGMAMGRSAQETASDIMAWFQENEADLEPTETPHVDAEQPQPAAPQSRPSRIEPFMSRGYRALVAAARRVIELDEDDASEWDDLKDAIRAMKAAMPKPRIAVEKEAKGETKKDLVTRMVSDGWVSAQEIGDATGWGNNTVRGFLATLKRSGITIETQKDLETKVRTYHATPKET